MAWYLQPMHAPTESAVALPREGTVTVGRRPGNGIICKDLAVSGQHCVFHCSISEAPEVEDCSTNGSYVNETKITKGMRHRLAADDVVSLTSLLKSADDAAGLDAPPRVQFRLEFRDRQEGEAVAAPDGRLPWQSAAGADVPPTAVDAKVAHGMEPVGPGADNCFAQDLLVQEQQSKAKITAQLLQSQGKLEEERQAGEAASRELEKVRKQVAEERARRHEAEESRDRLATEADTLRKERGQLQELRSSHEELRQRNEAVQLELQTRQQQCSQLQAAHEQLTLDLKKARDSHHQASQQQAELTTRLRQAQERAQKLEQEHLQAKKEADTAQADCARLENELSAEKAAREGLDEQVSKTKEEVSQAEASEQAARAALDAATAKRAELECQASSAHSDLEGARASARQAQQRLTASKQLVERLHDAGKGLSAELKRRAEVWEKMLADGNFDGLEEALSVGVPTFAQVTCQVESPAKSQPGDEDRACESNMNEHQNENNGVAAPQAAVERHDCQTSESEQRPAQPTASADLPPVSGSICPAADLPPPASVAGLTPSASVSILGPTAPAEPEQGGCVAVEEVVSDDDELMAAAAQEPAGDEAPAANAASAIGGTSAGALPGCSTAWSLEMLDATAPSGDLLQPAKRMRLSGD